MPTVQPQFDLDRMAQRLKKITPDLITAVKDQIVQNLHPEKIVLFGSQANGTATEGSDIDLLIVLDDKHPLTPLKQCDRLGKLLELFRYRSFGLEALENFYQIKFRPRQTRRQYHDLPRKVVGRVRYQVNVSCDGFRKGDVVRVKGKWVKQINSIYSNGYLAFSRVKGEPYSAKPKDCQLLQRGQTIIWGEVVYNEHCSHIGWV